MPFLDSTRQMYAKLEAAAGTSADPLDKANAYAAPTLSDVRVRAMEMVITPEVDDENSKYLNGDFSGDESIVAKINSTAKFSMKAEPAYFKAGTPNKHKIQFSKFLESCGTKQIVVKDPAIPSLDNVTKTVQYCYYPSMQAAAKTITLTSLSVDENKNGIAREIRGAIGNFKITADGTGKPLTIEYNYTGSTDANGVWSTTPVQSALLAFDSANVSTLPAEKYINTSITITNLRTLTASTFCSSTLSFDTGNVISTIDCQNTSSGVVAGTIEEMNPRLMIKPLMQTLANFNYWEALTTADEYSIDIVVDTTVADIPPIRLFVPRAEMLTAPDSIEGKKIAQEMTFRPLANIKKTLPVLKYLNNSTGAATSFLFAGSSIIGNEQGAVWFLMFGERTAV